MANSTVIQVRASEEDKKRAINVVIIICVVLLK